LITPTQKLKHAQFLGFWILVYRQKITTQEERTYTILPTASVSINYTIN